MLTFGADFGSIKIAVDTIKGFCGTSFEGLKFHWMDLLMCLLITVLFNAALLSFTLKKEQNPIA